MSYPRCFDSQEQFVLWIKADTYGRNGYEKKVLSSYCEDCLPSHALKMRKEGRCEHPEVFFKCGNGKITPSCETSKSSMYRHVCYHKGREKWMAYAFKDGKRTTIGYYDTEDLAHEARVAWANEQRWEAA